jgi:hypothetical protein
MRVLRRLPPSRIRSGESSPAAKGLRRESVRVGGALRHVSVLLFFGVLRHAFQLHSA